MNQSRGPDISVIRSHHLPLTSNIISHCNFHHTGTVDSFVLFLPLCIYHNVTWNNLLNRNPKESIHATFCRSVYYSEYVEFDWHDIGLEYGVKDNASITSGPFY